MDAALEKIKQQVEGAPIVIYIKGTAQFPMCGFSARAVQALNSVGAKFTAYNVLEDQDVYYNLPRYANWPTFPQLYIKGELIGGCDITLELLAQGELEKMVKEAMA